MTEPSRLDLSELQGRLSELPVPLAVGFAGRMAARALLGFAFPICDDRPYLWFLPENERISHTLAVCEAVKLVNQGGSVDFAAAARAADRARGLVRAATAAMVRAVARGTSYGAVDAGVTMLVSRAVRHTAQAAAYAADAASAAAAYVDAIAAVEASSAFTAAIETFAEPDGPLRLTTPHDQTMLVLMLRLAEFDLAWMLERSRDEPESVLDQSRIRALFGPRFPALDAHLSWLIAVFESFGLEHRRWVDWYRGLCGDAG